MRVETNNRVIKRNRSIAQYTFFISMGIWLASLGITFLPLFSDRPPDQLGLLELAATAVLPFALGLALFAVYMTNLWIREPRPEQVIRDGLKGMNKKSILYHYHHSPAKHVLIAPQGVFVMVVRWQRGDIVVKGTQWRFQRSLLARIPAIFRLENLGNPAAEAERAADYLADLLKPLVADIEVQPIIILTDSRVNLIEAEPSPIPILYAADKDSAGNKLKPNLTDFMRELKQSGATSLPLTPEQIDKFEETTLPKSD